MSIIRKYWKCKNQILGENSTCLNRNKKYWGNTPETSSHDHCFWSVSSKLICLSCYRTQIYVVFISSAHCCVKLQVESQTGAIIRRWRAFPCCQNSLSSSAHSSAPPRPSLSATLEFACSPAFLALVPLLSRMSNWQGGTSFRPQLSVMSSLPWTWNPDPFHQLLECCLGSLLSAYFNP